VELLKRHGSTYLTDTFLDICVEEAKGAVLYQDDGTKWLDMATGNFGCGVQEVLDGVVKQISAIPLSNRILISRRLAELVYELDKICPPEISVSYVCNSGEEAFDGALKLCKGYNKNRSKVCVVRGSDLGTLSYALLFKEIGTRYLSALGIDVVFLDPEDVSMADRMIKNDVLAVVFEPIIFADGIHRLSREYLQAIRRLSSECGCLMIDYEVRTGLGFSGSVLAINEASIVPDIVVLGGALSGGAVPVGAYVTKKEINDAVYGSKNPSLHGSTTGGNPASCSAAIAAISYLKSRRLDSIHREHGKNISVALGEIYNQSDSLISSYTSVGSFGCIEMRCENSALKIWRKCIDKKLILRRPEGRFLYMFPPLVASVDEIMTSLSIIADAVSSLSITPMEAAAV